MRIKSINPEPLLDVPFLNAGRSAGNFYEDRLPVHEGLVDRLPEGVSAVLATADLQGRERFQDRETDRPLRLLGEVLPLRLASEILPRLGLPAASKIGVLLAGDFYTVPALDRRGGSGDVTTVWEAFADHFAWVVGVAGNHDTFGSTLSPASTLANLQNLYYLDGDVASLGELKFGGIGGIIGNPRKPHRRSDEKYLCVMRSLLEHQLDVLLMHEGPDSPAHGFRGSPLLREVIEQSGKPLVVRGHAHWKQPLVELSSGVQVLNVDARVVVLRAQ